VAPGWERIRGRITPQDLLLPEGKLIRTTRGGTSALKQLLLDLKKYSFSGYVRTVRESSAGRAEGIVLLRGGNPEASLHQLGDSHERGREALKRVWQDSYDAATTIELHARVDMEGLVREHADAVLERPAKVMKRSKVPQPVAHQEIVAKIRAWRAKGFEVESVESLLEGDPALLTAAYLALREAIRKAEAVEATLESLDATGFEARAAALRLRLRDPLGHPDIDAEVESLRDAVEGHKRIEARHEMEQARERDSKERTKRVLELVIKQHQALKPESKAPTQEDLARVLAAPEPTRDPTTGLIQPLTFESFIVGESNRFAFGAAVAAAKPPHSGHNPLVVVSGPGLGKTHLLHAIGNRMEAHRKDAKILYKTAAEFLADVAAAKRSGQLGSFPERFADIDCLLLDDLQGMSREAEGQEELVQIFSSILARTRQVVVASDRPPKAIMHLDDRIVSRLEGGLVATIQPPDHETRVAILRLLAQQSNRRVDADVLNLIADLVEDNVRELGGAFNRVLAFSALMDRPITRDLAREVLREAGDAQPMEEKPTPRETAVPRTVELRPGRSYLIEEERPEEAFHLLTKALRDETSGIVITRTNPKRVREKFNLRAEKVLWLTDRESQSEETMAPTLERIVYEIEDFMTKRPRGAILLDGVEYLVSNNSFDAVLKFVRRLVDTVSEGHYIFLISLGPSTLKEQELKMLEREMEVVPVSNGPGSD
jgi:chromosomal replication initiator protein DnaA